MRMVYSDGYPRTCLARWRNINHSSWSRGWCHYINYYPWKVFMADIRHDVLSPFVTPEASKKWEWPNECTPTGQMILCRCTGCKFSQLQNHGQQSGYILAHYTNTDSESIIPDSRNEAQCFHFSDDLVIFIKLCCETYASQELSAPELISPR